MIRRFAFVIGASASVLLLLLGGATASPAQPSEDPSPHSDAELVSAVESVTPGEPFTVALRMTMEDGWHSYWKNPGDSGQPTSIEWSLPEGFTASAFQWPYPHRIEASMLTSYGYSNEVLLLATLTPPEDLQPGTSVTLAGNARWLICADICLPAEAAVERTLPVTASAPDRSAWADAIASTRSSVPRAVDGWTVQAARSSGSYTLALTPPDGRHPDLNGAYFFPSEKPVLDHAAPQPLSRQNGTYLLALQQSSYASTPADTLRGVLVAPEGTSWDADESVRAMTVTAPVDSVLSMPAASASNSPSLSLPWALLFAALGGLLLNLMPCVFPVLSVKILGFVRDADGDAASLRRHGFLFAAGVLVSMWTLAGVLFALRAAGSQIGWGFQLQSPSFVALMALLFVGIGLNLLGAFEVGTRLTSMGGRLQSASPSEGTTGAFLTGVLATVVATPCTAPFMGAALGVALTLSVGGGLLVFTALGAGMAAPYVGLSMAPRLLDRLPDPGAWMETLKQFFAFPMFATAVWLVWVFGQQTGNNGVALLLFGMLLLGMAAWVLHRWSAPQLSRAATYATRGLVTALLLGAVAAGVLGATSNRTASASGSDEAAASSATWQTYSADTVERLRSQGRPVFVDFTAAWCLTCQVNERAVLNTQPVQDAFAQRNVALVKADWTNRDPAITQALKSHGRSGVPVYVLYPGDGSGPTLLPEVLTEDIVLDALDAIPAASASS